MHKLSRTRQVPRNGPAPVGHLQSSHRHGKSYLARSQLPPSSPSLVAHAIFRLPDHCPVMWRLLAPSSLVPAPHHIARPGLLQLPASLSLLFRLHAHLLVGTSTLYPSLSSRLPSPTARIATSSSPISNVGAKIKTNLSAILFADSLPRIITGLGRMCKRNH
jgi:hypothetical protein